MLAAMCLLLFVVSVQAQEEASVKAKEDALVYYVDGASDLEYGYTQDIAVEAWLDDTKIAANSKYGDIVGPIFLKPGKYRYHVYQAGLGPDKGYTPASETTLTYEPGEVVLHVAHYTEKGFTGNDVLDDIVMTKFPLDFSPLIDKKKARVLVFHCAAASHLTALFYNTNQPDNHPLVGHEAMENRDKFVTEIGKGFKWALWVQEGREGGLELYNKNFKIKSGKAHIVVIVGTPGTESFRVLTKIHKKKLK
jgi:hypothetical protein